MIAHLTRSIFRPVRTLGRGGTGVPSHGREHLATQTPGVLQSAPHKPMSGGVMARKLLVGCALGCLLTLPVQSFAQADSGRVSPVPGSSAATPSAAAEQAGWAGVTGTAARAKSKLGDKDNFGYGLGTGPAPCAFYDLREPEDVGVF